MPNSYYDITYSSGTSVAFNNTDLEYLETAHLELIATNTTSGTSTTFKQTDATTFTVSVANATTTIDFTAILSLFPTGTNKIRVSRVTPSANLLTNFVNSSLLRAEDLNQNSQQLLFVLQEQIDAGTGSLPLTAADEFDAGTRKIINLEAGEDTSDAATYGQLSAITGGITNTPSVPQVYSFALGTNGVGGTFSNPNTTFTLSPAPTSNIDGTFIVEVAGVIQRPGTDFTVNGNVLTLLNTNLTTDDFNNTSIIVQNFGLSKNVFSFPVTGEAVSNTETPLTLKGALDGDATTLLDVKDSSGTSNTTISADGTVKAKKVEPLTSGSLAVNPTTITTSSTISSGGNLSVGSSFDVTHSSGDVTANKITLGTTSGFGTNDVVTKAYVDSSGGAGGSITSDTNLNSMTTAGRFSGSAPNTPSSFNYPDGVQSSNQIILIVNELGGIGSGFGNQELHVYQDLASQKIFKYYRLFTGGNTSTPSFGNWCVEISNKLGLDSLAAPTGSYNMSNNRIFNLPDPSNAGDVVNRRYVDERSVIAKKSVRAAGHFVFRMVNSGVDSSGDPGNLEVITAESFNINVRRRTHTQNADGTSLATDLAFTGTGTLAFTNANITPLIYITPLVNAKNLDSNNNEVNANSVGGPWNLVTNHSTFNTITDGLPSPVTFSEPGIRFSGPNVDGAVSGPIGQGGRIDSFAVKIMMISTDATA